MKIANFDDFVFPTLANRESLIAGVDEVGRGAWFGPVVAGAVLFPFGTCAKLREMGVKDSKQLSAKKRSELEQQIKNLATNWAIASASVAEIEQLNIRQASLLAMRRAVLKLEKIANLCLVDGREIIPNLSINQQSLIRGDQRSPIIAAASIIAKVWRDNLIINLANNYPEYDLAANKGYGTKKHRLALEKYGILPEHRRSFRPCKELG